MNLRPKILIAESEDFNPEAISLLQNYADITIENKQKNELKHVFKEYDIVWFRLGFKINKEILEGNLKCRVIVTPVTGLDHIDEKLCYEKGIEIISLRGEKEFLKKVRATAELTIGMTIALLRKMIPSYNSVLRGEWNRDNFRGNEIFEKNVGIIGMGRLGRIVGVYFLSFGANVMGYDINNDFPEGIQKANDLEELLEWSDIVSCHLSYTNDTKNIIGKEMFGLFKKGAILINTSRGGVIDESALLEALESGRLNGAALDVIKNESNVSPGNKLIEYAQKNSNLLIFPHIGGNTFESFEKTELFLAEKLVQKINSTHK